MISNEFKKRVITSILLFLILLIMFLNQFFLIFIMIIISIIMVYEFYKLTPNFILRVSILAYLSFFLLFMIYGQHEFFKTIENRLLFFYPIFVSILSDIGGYIFGKTFKGKKLSMISPNKTISGSFGAFLFSIILVPFFQNYFFFLNMINLFIITIFLSFISQFGDLFISYFKRISDKKDTGNILPGHGGLLDRFDGMLFSLPIGFFIFYFLIK